MCMPCLTQKEVVSEIIEASRCHCIIFVTSAELCVILYCVTDLTPVLNFFVRNNNRNL